MMDGMETTTLTLTDFLLARIAEDEAAARDARTWADLMAALAGGPNARHGARHDPTRVLAECEAKRRIVELHPSSDEWEPGHGTGRFCEGCADWIRENDEGQPPTLPWPCPTLRALAAVYADHPDFREEWRPAD